MNHHHNKQHYMWVSTHDVSKQTQMNLLMCFMHTLKVQTLHYLN